MTLSSFSVTFPWPGAPWCIPTPSLKTCIYIPYTKWMTRSTFPDHRENSQLFMTCQPSLALPDLPGLWDRTRDADEQHSTHLRHSYISRSQWHRSVWARLHPHRSYPCTCNCLTSEWCMPRRPRSAAIDIAAWQPHHLPTSPLPPCRLLKHVQRANYTAVIMITTGKYSPEFSIHFLCKVVNTGKICNCCTTTGMGWYTRV